MDSHLHQFLLPSRISEIANVQCIAFPMPEMEDVIDERKVKLSQYFKQAKNTLWYEYDFGDSWMHEVKLEKILPREAKEKYPVLLGGKYACPIEDSGALWGYCDKLEILKNPKDKEYKDVLEWLGIDDGNEFDPEELDPDAVEFHDSGKRLREYKDNFSL